MLTILKMIGVVLLADFVTGLVHWLEDVYAKPGMPLVHQIAVDNELHHTKPRAFLEKNWWQSCWDVALVALLLIIVTWYFDLLSWEIALFAVLVTNGNQIHKWSHQTKKENGRLVTFLQNMHLIQNAKHHARHHTGLKNTHYCVITPLLNPVLENLSFWRFLEDMNRKLFSPLPSRLQ